MQVTKDMKMTQIQPLPLRNRFHVYVITTDHMNVYGNCLTNVLSVNSRINKKLWKHGIGKGLPHGCT